MKRTMRQRMLQRMLQQVLQRVLLGALAVLVWAFVFTGPAHAQTCPPSLPVPVPYYAPATGYLTVVIEDQDGGYVRDLVSAIPVSMGTGVLCWDAYNFGWSEEVGDAPYDISRTPVTAGQYVPRAYFHEGMELIYEGSPYTGNTLYPWDYQSKGSWGSDHQAWYDVTFMPAALSNVVGGEGRDLIILTAKTAEVGSNIVAIDAETFEMVRGAKWSGQQGPKRISIDRSPSRDLDNAVYGLYYNSDKPNPGPAFGIGSANLGRDGNNDYQPKITDPISNADGNIMGSATWSQTTWVSSIRDSALYVAYLPDTPRESRTYRGRTVLARSPRGLWIDDADSITVVYRTSIERCERDDVAVTISGCRVLSTGQLDDGRDLWVVADTAWVADWSDHTVRKINLATGALMQTYGRPGGQQVGGWKGNALYQPSPAVDHLGRIWASSFTKVPKYVTAFNYDGSVDTTIEGMVKYGGAGMPWGGFSAATSDSTRWIIGEEGYGMSAKGLIMNLGPEFWGRQDVTERTGTMHSIPYDYGREAPPEFPDPVAFGEHGITIGACEFLISQNEIQNVEQEVATIHRINADSTATLAGAFGIVGEWPAIQSLGEASGLGWAFAYGDQDLDGVPESGEVVYFQLGGGDTDGGVAINPLKLEMATIHGNVVTGVTVNQANCTVNVSAAQEMKLPGIVGSGRFDAVALSDTFFVNSVGPVQSYNRHTGQLRYYHSQYPTRWKQTLDPEPPDPQPGDAPGKLMETVNSPTHLVHSDWGTFFILQDNDGGTVLFTGDLMFVAELFGDYRRKPGFDNLEVAEVLTTLPGTRTLRSEHYYTKLFTYPSGQLGLMAGKNFGGVWRLKWLGGGPRRIAMDTVTVTQEMIDQSVAENGPSIDKPYDESLLPGSVRDTLVAVVQQSGAYSIDGSLQDWPTAAFKYLDQLRGWQIAAGLVETTPGDTAIVVGISLGQDSTLFTSQPGTHYIDGPIGGGGIDVWIGKSGANPERSSPVVGDRRFWGSKNEGGTNYATVYHPLAASSDSSETWESPTFIYTINDVRLASGTLMARQGGTYEFLIPLAATGATPALDIVFDAGVITGNSSGAQNRVYFNGKQLTIVDDIAREMEFRMEPLGWLRRGTLDFVGTGGGANVAPVVTMTSPTTGATYPEGTAVTLAATATDADGTISSCEFRRDPDVLHVDFSAPYSYTFTPNIGTYAVYARCYDDRGLPGSSSSVVFTVGFTGNLTAKLLGNASGSLTNANGKVVITGTGATGFYRSSSTGMMGYSLCPDTATVWVARIDSVQSAPSPWSGGTVLMAADTSVSAPGVFVTSYMEGTRLRATYRTSDQTNNFAGSVPYVQLPVCVRLRRTGDQLEVHYAQAFGGCDTVGSWTAMPSLTGGPLVVDLPEMGPSAVCGVGASSRKLAESVRTVFTNLSITVQ